MLDKLFKLSERNTTVLTEVQAGGTTFLTMAYIIFVNPAILAEAGMDQGAVFVATCLAAAIGCFIMGFIANFPLAVAPGMGLNAFFTYGVVITMGYTWETALGAVFISGILFFFMSLFKIREWVINAIPRTLKLGIATGIGAFLAMIALKNAEIVVDHPATLVTLGNLTDFVPLMSMVGFFLIAALIARKVKGGVLISILAVTAIGIVFGDVKYDGILSAPPSLAPTFMTMDIMAALELSMIGVIFAFLFVDLFDTSGTLIAVTQKAGLTDSNGNVPNLGKALLSDSSATLVGAALGTSNTTSYVESVAGVAEGGRTGLTAVTVGILFLIATLFSPVAGMIPIYATAGALFYVAILMLDNLREIDWSDITEAAPVAIVLLLTPLTFSIANGIMLAFITYAFVKAICGKAREVSISVWLLSAIFIVKIIFVD